MISPVHPAAQRRHVPRYVANSLGDDSSGVDPITGDLISDPSSDPAAWYDVLGQLQGWNSDLKAAETALRSYVQALQSQGLPVTTAELQADSQSLLSNRQSYNQWSGNFIDAYRAAFGSVPTGLSGVGLGFDAVTALGYAALIAAILGAVALLWPVAQALRQKYEAALVTAHSVASLNTQAQQLITQANAADAAGNSTQASTLRAEAQALMTQANTTGAGSGGGGGGSAQDWGKWLQDNAVVVTLGVAAIFIVPRALK